MATPIAHKGVVAGAKVQAMTMLDFLTTPELVDAGVGLLQQRADQGPEVHPVHRQGHAAADVAEQGDPRRSTAPEMKKYYYDPSKYPTYLEQLGIKYPTVRGGGTQ